MKPGIEKLVAVRKLNHHPCLICGLPSCAVVDNGGFMPACIIHANQAERMGEVVYWQKRHDD